MWVTGASNAGVCGWLEWGGGVHILHGPQKLSVDAVRHQTGRRLRPRSTPFSRIMAAVEVIGQLGQVSRIDAIKRRGACARAAGRAAGQIRGA